MITYNLRRSSSCVTSRGPWTARPGVSAIRNSTC